MSIEVKVGQRWKIDGVECRVAAICEGVLQFDDGRWDYVEDFHESGCELLPSRENEYVQGEIVELTSNGTAVTYVCELPAGSEFRHVVEFSDKSRGCFTSKDICRHKPAMKWVVPTQADIDEATEPIPCLVRDYDSGEWKSLKLLGIARFQSHRFWAPPGHWKYCLIQVPANDPREAVEVQS